MFYYEGEIKGYRSGTDFNTQRDIERFELLMSDFTIGLMDSRDYPLIIDDLLGGIKAAVTEVDDTPVLVISRNWLEELEELKMDSSIHVLNSVMVHEFKHLEQMEEGRLRVDTERIQVIWEGKVFEPILDIKSIEYLKQPWEWEAHEAEIKYAIETGFINSMEEGWDIIMSQLEN